MKENVWCATLKISTEQYGAFVFRCEQASISGLEETEEGMKVYLDPGQQPSSWEDRLAEWAGCDQSSIEWEEIEATNWNRKWEMQFEPVEIGTFCGIRAPFHPPFEQSVDHEIIIQPKMAFGTGHHETTAMMIEAMEGVSWRGQDVLDWGAGTGILAILARKLGANRVVALEIDEDANVNLQENIKQNQVDITARNAGLEVLQKDEYFDIILANINRNVLLNDREKLVEHAKEGTKFLLSGIQRRDIPLVQSAYWSNWNQAVELHFRGNWVCIEFEWQGT